ncbi:MAG TPA: NAD-dependent epimerase/dehydratase family protein [Puia sp.]|jgi:dTDP-6-deoxy-L-talose 4-dehydrogenase (NAD+)
MSRKVLVTGVTGFIGPYVIDQLLQAGHTVIASSANEEKARLQSWYPDVEYIPFNLATASSGDDYYDLFGRPDHLIHLAWEGLPNYKAAFHLEENLPRHQIFLENLVRGGLNDLTVTGTCFEYGMQEGCLKEDGPIHPANPYALAKTELYLFLRQLQTENPFSLKWARLFYMYGKGQNPNSLFSQLDKALAGHEPAFNMSGGQQVRDYLPVETAARYLTSLALQQKLTGIVNCCSGQPVTVEQAVRDYLARNQQSITLNLGYYAYPDYEPFRFWGDTSKLKTILPNE